MNGAKSTDETRRDRAVPTADGPASSRETAPDSRFASGDEAGDAARPYHHGDLRGALIEESRRLVNRHGVDAFKVSDACKTLGVSTAAPYRHFQDRDALLDAVCAASFDNLSKALRAARDAHPKGSVEGVIALGQTYVRFAAENREMFHLMWGAVRDSVEAVHSRPAGQACYGVLLETVGELRAAQGLDHLPVEALATPLWAGVHGFAHLLLSGKLEIVSNVDPYEIIAQTSRAQVAGLAQMRDAAENAVAAPDETHLEPRDRNAGGGAPRESVGPAGQETHAPSPPEKQRKP